MSAMSHYHCRACEITARSTMKVPCKKLFPVRKSCFQSRDLASFVLQHLQELACAGAERCWTCALSCLSDKHGRCRRWHFVCGHQLLPFGCCSRRFEQIRVVGDRSHVGTSCAHRGVVDYRQSSRRWLLVESGQPTLHSITFVM